MKINYHLYEKLFSYEPEGPRPNSEDLKRRNSTRSGWSFLFKFELNRAKQTASVWRVWATIVKGFKENLKDKTWKIKTRFDFLRWKLKKLKWRVLKCSSTRFDHGRVCRFEDTSWGLVTAPLHQGVQCNTHGRGPTEAVHGWFMTWTSNTFDVHETLILEHLQVFHPPNPTLTYSLFARCPVQPVVS